MRFALTDYSDWQPAPFAWFPKTYEKTVYWLERPPYEVRFNRDKTKDSYLPTFDYRRAGDDEPCGEYFVMVD